MNRWTIEKLQGGLGEHAAAWDALLQRLFVANPMLDSRFVDALVQYFGDGSEYICIMRSEDVVQAMCVLRPRGLGIWTSFLPSQAQIGPTLLFRPDDTRGLFGTLPGINGQIDFLCNDPAFGDLTETDPRNISCQDHALTVSVNITGDFETYWSARSRNLTHNMNKHVRRLAADGVSASFVCVRDAAQIEAAVLRYAALESKGWKGRLGTAVSAENAQGAFYADIASRFAQSNGASVHELWLGDQLAASLVTIAMGGIIVLLKTSYDESLNRYAPGRLLLRNVIQYAFDAYPGGMIEFYTDANAEMLAWATSRRWIKHVSVYRGARTANMLMLLRASRQLIATPKGVSLSFPDAPGEPPSVELFTHPDQLPADVLRLFESAEATAVEFGIPWFKNLVNTVYPQDAGVRIYVMRKKGVPVAAIPVRVVQTGLGRGVESLANYYTALYAPAIATDLRGRELVPLLKVMVDGLAPFCCFRFEPMDPQADAFLKLLNALRIAGLLPFQFFCFGNWFMNVNESWPAYLGNRSGSLRNTIKRHGKKFTSDGGTLQLVSGGDMLESAINAYERVYAASWKLEEPYPNFMPGLIRTCAEHGWLRLAIAWLKQEPIAAQVWIVKGKKAEIYKLAFHKDYKEYAPGTLLTAMLMQHVIGEDQVTEVDYLIGDDPYKTTWMTQRRERWGIIAYSPKSMGGLLGLGRELVGSLLQPARTAAVHTWSRLIKSLLRNRELADKPHHDGNH